jgi:8-oxo-dGTP pyrophosphatase MutT (NUDIX family)
MDKNLGHYIVVTVIPVNIDGKFLICKRADWEKAFPGQWTVPGGKMEVLDYALRDRDTKHHWYNVFEETARREVKEETGLNVNELGYVTSLVYLRSDKIPCIIVSLYALCNEKNVKLDRSLVEYAWVTLEEAKKYDLIDGIYEELKVLDKQLKTGKNISWIKGM